MADIVDMAQPAVEAADATLLTDTALKPSDTRLLQQLAMDRSRRPKTTERTRTGAQVLGDGRRRRTAPPPKQEPTTPEEARRQRQAQLRFKRERVQELTKQIVVEGNEMVMQALMGMGVPARFLYNEVPEEQKVSEKYTTWGNRIAIKPTQAKILATFAAEMERSDFGEKALDVVTGDSPIRLLFLGVMAAGVAVNMTKNAMDLRKELEPYIEAYRRARMEQSEAQKQYNQAASQKAAVGSEVGIRG